jgi:uncharacterized phiE125 gp8 family phage protein
MELSRQDALQLIEPPAALPISLSEVRQQLRVDYEGEDEILARLISTAVAYTDAQGALGQAMITQKWGQWVGPNPTQIVRLMLGPLVEVTAVKYYDTDGNLQTDTLANYEITGTEFSTTVGPKSGNNWPVTAQRPDAIRIEYTAGYGSTSSAVPQSIRHALMLLVGHWYESRENTGVENLMNIPFGFDALIGMHRRCWYG